MDVGHCFEQAAKWIRRSVSGATWNAYSKVWREWQVFTDGLGIPPAGQEAGLALLHFLNLKMEEGVSASAIDRLLAGLAFLFKWHGGRDFTKDFWVKQSVKGYRKGRRTPDGRRPVSFLMLQSLFRHLQSVCNLAYEIALFQAAFALAFFGALRIGELVSASRTAHGGLLEGDVELWGDEVGVWVRRSKTDQEGKGMRLSLFRVPDATICPVRAVEHFCSVRSSPRGFLFGTSGWVCAIPLSVFGGIQEVRGGGGV